MQEWARNRAKEKEEERLAREKVRAMIAQDRYVNLTGNYNLFIEVNVNHYALIFCNVVKFSILHLLIIGKMAHR